MQGGVYYSGAWALLAVLAASLASGRKHLSRSGYEICQMTKDSPLHEALDTCM